MRVIDSSAWIEWLAGSPVGRRVQAELPALEAWVVPTIVQFELMRWLTRERSVELAAETVAFTTQLVVAPLDTQLATKAADFASRHSLAMADAIIFATAVEYGADLLTCDAHFKNLPGVVYLPKSAG
jgi:predicted nucleic acid-binding protein